MNTTRDETRISDYLQATTLDPSKLRAKIADLPAGPLGQIDAALKAALAIP